MTDMVTGIYGALGAVMALLSRKATGRSQLVDAALYESAFSLMEPHVPAYQQLGHRIIGEWTVGFDLDALDALLRRFDVPASRVFTMADIFRDPHFAPRDAIVHAGEGELASVALPKLSETPGRIEHAGREIGADTVHVLTRYAGMTPAEIEDLLAAGVAFDAARVRARSAAPAKAPPRLGALADPT